MNNFDLLYDELIQISTEILPYYDIDKIKPYSIYIWTKGEDGKNVFDINADEIIHYDAHINNKRINTYYYKNTIKIKRNW